MRITVKTGSADKPAPDITDNLLSSTESKLERGTQELFASVDAYQKTVSMPMQSMINAGEIGEIQDNQYGHNQRGIVTGIAININPASKETPHTIDLIVDLEAPL